MSKVYYVRDERLIRNSKVIEEHSILSEVFEKYPELDNVELKELSDEIQMFFKNIYPKIIMEAIHEWDVDESFRCEILDDDKKIKCQLCHHDIKNICQIKNKENGNTLKVGTECVKHFEFNSKIDVDKLLEERRYIKRLEKLNFEIPDIEGIMSRWNIIIDEQSIYIKSSITEKYYTILDEIKNLYMEYTGKKNITIIREFEIIDLINSLLKESHNEKEKISMYINESKSNKLIPTKGIINYLKRVNDSVGIEWIDEDGIIKCRTLFRIKEEDFVKSLVPEFNLVMSKNGIALKETKFYNNKIGYLISLEQNSNAKVFCQYDDFIMAYGGIITNEEVLEKINQSEILNMGELRDEESIDFALGIIENSLKGYSIEYDEFFYKFNDVLWKKNKDGKEQYYILTKLDKLYSLLKELAFGIKTYTPGEIHNIIINNSRTLGNSEAKDFKKNRNR